MCIGIYKMLCCCAGVRYKKRKEKKQLFFLFIFCGHTYTYIQACTHAHTRRAQVKQSTKYY
ncbi:hypothetical protein BDC45DRAFT_520686 [Circinella umbellata]|nr:hypothetical protein BDC45DRAFT_520686 [Circinella umbellata]